MKIISHSEVYNVLIGVGFFIVTGMQKIVPVLTVDLADPIFEWFFFLK